MSLDLARTALQIDGMAADLRAREGRRQGRIGNALRALQGFPLDEYAARRGQGGDEIRGGSG